MHRTVRRRLLGAAAAATAAVAVATPAYAAAPQVVILIPDSTVAAGGSTIVVPFLFADQQATLAHSKMTFELGAGLAGVTLKAPGPIPGCTQNSPTSVTCALTSGLDVGPDGSIGDFAAELAATKAAVGETGKLTVTLSADGIDPVKKTVDVNVAEGVDLAAGKNSEISVKPGTNFGADLQVHNNSESVVHGVSVIFDTDFAYATTKQFSNCFYGDGQVTACTFDEDLKPGATYQLTMPYQLRKDTAAPSKVSGQFEWLTAGDWDDLIKFLKDSGLGDPGAPGTGDKLTLKQLVSSQSLKQTDPNPENNWQEQQVNVTGTQKSDLAAIGASVSGAVGATVTVPVGVKNNGPADLDWGHNGPAAAALVTMPTGATVTTVPDACELNTPDGVLEGDPSKVQYACFTDTVLPAGKSVIWKFGVKLDKAMTNATGSIVLNPKCDCDLYHDGNKANDTAKIVLNAAVATNPGGGHGDAGLPITGPQTALVGAAGAALLAGGVAFFVVSRRRRTRFEA